jgi:hypothetical protein
MFLRFRKKVRTFLNRSLDLFITYKEVTLGDGPDLGVPLDSSGVLINQTGEIFNLKGATFNPRGVFFSNKEAQ